MDVRIVSTYILTLANCDAVTSDYYFVVKIIIYGSDFEFGKCRQNLFILLMSLHCLQGSNDSERGQL